MKAYVIRVQDLMHTWWAAENAPIANEANEADNRPTSPALDSGLRNLLVDRVEEAAHPERSGELR